MTPKLEMYLQVVLQVVDQEGHVVAQAPLDGVHLGGLEVLPLHLQRPAVLELRLHPPHAEQVPEHHVVPERSRLRRNEGNADTHRTTTHKQPILAGAHFSRTAGVNRMCSGHLTL